MFNVVNIQYYFYSKTSTRPLTALGKLNFGSRAVCPVDGTLALLESTHMLVDSTLASVDSVMAPVDSALTSVDSAGAPVDNALAL